MTCTCTHRALSHAYQMTTHRNDGHCLSRGCTCTNYRRDS